MLKEHMINWIGWYKRHFGYSNEFGHFLGNENIKRDAICTGDKQLHLCLCHYSEFL